MRGGLLHSPAETHETQLGALISEKRGGKLIIYHGWADAALAPTNSVDYYENVIAKMGRKD
jgi:Tannase and feruloyl esterase